VVTAFLSVASSLETAFYMIIFENCLLNVLNKKDILDKISNPLYTEPLPVIKIFFICRCKGPHLQISLWRNDT